MRDVIQKIIATESEARITVEAARAEADRIMSDAQKKGRDIIEQSRQKTLIEADKILETALETAEREKQHRLTDAAAEIEIQIQLEPAIRKRAVEGVIRCVCKQP
jgi:vacuolar-type H+-ATPase subunit H